MSHDVVSTSVVVVVMVLGNFFPWGMIGGEEDEMMIIFLYV